MSPYISLKSVVLHVLSDSSLFLFGGLGSLMSFRNLIVLFPPLQIFDCPVSSSWRTALILSFLPQACLAAEWYFRPPWTHPFCGVVFLTFWIRLVSSCFISSVCYSSQTHCFCLIFCLNEIHSQLNADPSGCCTAPAPREKVGICLIFSEMWSLGKTWFYLRIMEFTRRNTTSVYLAREM